MSVDGHKHTFGRGANGACRECGAESNAGRKRREARERKPAQTAKPFDLHAALKAKGDQ